MIKFQGYTDSEEVSSARDDARTFLFNSAIDEETAEKKVAEFNEFARSKGVPESALLITRAQARKSSPNMFFGGK